MSIYKMRTELGHYFKWLLLLVLVPIFAFSAFNYFGPGARGGGEREGGSEVIAEVGGQPITAGDFQAEWLRAYEEAKGKIFSPLKFSDVRAAIFEQMVRNKMLMQAAEQMGLDVSDAAVEAEVDKIVTESLNRSRQTLLGKLSPERLKSDPRDDEEFAQALESVNSSIDQEERTVRDRIPIDQVKAQMVQQGLQSKFMSSIKPVTEKDIVNSFNHYKIRVILLKNTGLPTAQLLSKAKKIADEARSGADFVALARKYSDDPSSKKGNSVNYSFESSFFYPADMRKFMEGAKAGDISDPITTPMGIIVVKVESVKSQPPSTLDKKTKDQRAQQMRFARAMEARNAFEDELNRKQRVVVKDPELRAYWELAQARSAANPADYKKALVIAAKSLQDAIAKRENNQFARAKLAEVKRRMGDNNGAIAMLYRMLEGAGDVVEGADLRLLLGDALLDNKEIDKALTQYKIASEVATRDDDIHRELITRYQKLNKPDLVAYEQKWITDFTAKKKQWEERQFGRRGGPRRADSKPTPSSQPASGSRR